MPAPQLPVSAPPDNILESTKLGDVVYGGSGRDHLIAKHIRVFLGGGAGDDTYTILTASAAQYHTNTAVGESPNQGIDTIYAGSSMVLPINVENIHLTSSSGWRFAMGNSGDNIITSAGGSDFLTTGGGNDVMTGGGGRNTFGFTKDANTTAWVTDFDPGFDRLNLTNLGFTSFAQVQAATSQVGTDLKISVPGNNQAVMLENTTADALTAGNVIVDSPSGVAARRLTFADEFNAPISLRTGAPGTLDNTWKTTFFSGDRRLYGNSDEQIYVDPDYKGNTSTALGLNPFSVDNGVLTIKAAPTPTELLPSLYNIKYTSGMISTQTSFEQTYGYFEMRADTPLGKGMFPAFWLLPKTGTWPPEIDVMEQIGSRPDYVSQGIGSSAARFQNLGVVTGIDMTQGFHTYGMEWTAQKVTWFIDGVQTFQVITPGDMHQPMYMLVTFAVGGSWPGSPLPTTDWSQAELKIDYIRAYALDAVQSTLQTILSNATNPKDISDVFALPVAAAGTSETFTAATMDIAGVAASTTVTAEYGPDGDLILTNNAAWNAIKNAIITDTAERGVDVRNFVDTEITLGDGNDQVAVTGAKRGTIATGGGNDTIAISGTSNDAINNLIKVLSGDGDDLVSFTGGKNSKAQLDGGAANDTLSVAGQAGGSMLGGAGDDSLTDLSSGNLTLTGAAGADVFAFSAAGKSTVADYVDGTDRIELIGVDPLLVQSTISGADTLLDLGGGASVKLVGVNLTLAQLDIVYV